MSGLSAATVGVSGRLPASFTLSYDPATHRIPPSSSGLHPTSFRPCRLWEYQAVHSYSTARGRSGSRSTAGSFGKHAAPSSPGRARGPRQSGRHGTRHRPARPAYRFLAVGVLGGIAASLVIFEYQ